MNRLSQTGGALGIPLGECTHEHHPPPAKALFGGRQADPECLGDGRYGPAYGIVENDDRPVAGRQPDERIFKLVAQFCARQDLLWIDAVVIVMPAFLDVGDDQLVVLRP